MDIASEVAVVLGTCRWDFRFHRVSMGERSGVIVAVVHTAGRVKPGGVVEADVEEEVRVGIGGRTGWSEYYRRLYLW